MCPYTQGSLVRMISTFSNAQKVEVSVLLLGFKTDGYRKFGSTTAQLSFEQ
jgi:hypothetical protein